MKKLRPRIEKGERYKERTLNLLSRSCTRVGVRTCQSEDDHPSDEGGSQEPVDTGVTGPLCHPLLVRSGVPTGLYSGNGKTHTRTEAHSGVSSERRLRPDRTWRTGRRYRLVTGTPSLLCPSPQISNVDRCAETRRDFVPGPRSADEMDPPVVLGQLSVSGPGVQHKD